MRLLDSTEIPLNIVVISVTHLALPDSRTLVVVKFGIHVRIHMVLIFQLFVECRQATESSCFSASIPANIKNTYINKINKSVAYSSQGSHTGQLDFCNWQADGSTMG